STSEIYMTTRLSGAKTVFLPFNRGNNGAAGNPPAQDGTYAVSYLWEQILQPDNWLRIFHRFMLLEKKEKQHADGRPYISETMIFPRYHQWEAVTALIETVREEGPGQRYLIQHSAGSGKTNSISWTCHELIRLRKPDGAKYFDSVIVITDRTVLDAQLQDAIQQIDHQMGVVRAIDRESSPLPKSQQLAEALKARTPIIVVTIQTFPYAMEAILSETSLKDRNFALVIDEAHTSQTGSSAAKLRATLALDKDEDLASMTSDEILLRLQEVKKFPPNVSYFAFTATPKHATLTLFGRPADPSQPASKQNPPLPFHVYTMQQAIEEGFILDVLRNYTSYRVAFKLGQAFKEDKRVDARQARRNLAKWLSLHPTNVAQKVELIVEHFRSTVSHLLNGLAKAMVVTGSRAAAVKYKLAFDQYVTEKGYSNIRALVAFSGKVPGGQVEAALAGEEFDENNLNPE
ncbi:MAG: type I restriction endonuclease subunit R, partial [Gammaproteobacteria bacterium]